MARTVDERVVQAKFDNSQFDKNIEESIKTLEEFKKSLNLEGSAKSLEEISKASKDMDLSHLEKAVEKLEFRFSLLGERVHSVFNNMINKAEEFSKKFTIDPVKMGLSEYEEKMDAIKLALANTKWEGTTLDDVKNTLEDLNIYADQTIYKFSDMTSNLGKFTAQGIGLKDSATAIQGISNLAALTGANTEAASRAMYNFSQALAIGKMELRDWRTMENTGMGNKEFREQLILTAKELGYFDREWRDGQNHVIKGTELMTEAQNSFRETLRYGWMDNKLMLATLQKYADDSTEIGKRAKEAAVEITTFTKLIDVMQESFQSGWAYVWEKIIGDYEQAKKMWTELGIYFGDLIENMFDGLKRVLDEWQNLGGRFALMDTFRLAWRNLVEVIDAVRQGIANVFPPMTGQTLMDLTMKVLNFVNGMRLSETSLHNITKIVEILLKVFKNLGELLGKILKKLEPILKVANIILGVALDLVAELLDFIFAAGEAANFSEKFGNALDVLKTVLFVIVKILADVVGGFIGFIDKAKDLPIVQTIIDNIKISIQSLGDKAVPILQFVGDKFKEMLDKIEAFGRGDYIQNGITKLDTVLTNLYWTMNSGKGVTQGFFNLFAGNDKLSDRFLNLADALILFNNNTRTLTGGDGAIPNLSRLEDGLDTMGETTETIFTKIKNVAGVVLKNGLLGAIVLGLSSFLITVSRATDSFRRVLNTSRGLITATTGTLKAFQAEIKAKAILKIVGAIMALAGALLVLTIPDADKLRNAALSLGILSASLAAMAGALGFFSKKDLFGTFNRGSTMMLSMATSMMILVVALNSIDDSVKDWPTLAKKLTGLLGIMAILGGVYIAISRLGGHGTAFGVAKALTILAFAKGIEMIVTALERLSKMDLKTVEKAMPTLMRIMSKLAVVMFASSLLSPLAGIGFLGVVAGIIALVEGFKLLVTLTPEEMYQIDHTLELLAGVMTHVEGVAWAIAAIFAVANLVKNVTRNITGIAATITNNVNATFNLIGDAVGEAIKGLTFVAKVAIIVAAFVATAATIKMLAEIPEEIFRQGAIRAAGIAGTMILITGIIGMMAKHLEIADSLKGISSRMLGIGVVLLGMAAVMKVSAGLNQNGDMERALIAVGGCLGIILVFEILMNKLVTMQPQVAVGIKTGAAMALCLGVLALALGVLSSLTWEELWPAAVSLGATIGILALALHELATVSTGPAVASALGIMGVMVVLTACFYTLQEIEWTSIVGQLIELVVTVGLLAGIEATLATMKQDAVQGIAVIAAVAGMMIIMAAVASTLESLDPATLGKNLAIIGAAVLVFAGAIAGVTVLVRIAPVVASAVAGAIMILAGAAIDMILFATAAKIFSEAAQNLANTFVTLEGIDLWTIANGVFAIASASTSLGATSIGMFAAGIAWGLWASSVKDLGTPVTELATNLDTLTTSIDKLLAVDPKKLAESINNIEKALYNFASEKANLQQISDILSSLLPDIATFSDTIQNMDQNMNFATENVGKFADEVLKAAESLVKFIDEIENFNDAVDGLWMQVVSTIKDEIEGAADMMMPDAGRYIIDKVVEGCNDEIATAATNIGQDLIDGIVLELKSNGQTLYDSGHDAGVNWLTGLIEYLGAYCKADSTVLVAHDLRDGLIMTTDEDAGEYTSSGRRAGGYWIDGLTENVVETKKAAESAASSFNAAAIDQNGTFTSAGEANGKAYASGLVGAFQRAWDAIGNVFSGGVGTFRNGAKVDQNETRIGPIQRAIQSVTNPIQEQIDKVTGSVEGLVTGLGEGIDATKYYEQAQKEVEEAQDKAKEAVEEATEGLEDYSTAATGAGKAAKGASGDIEKLEKSMKALYMSTDVLQKEYGDLLESIGVTDGIAAANQELAKLGMTVEDFGDMWQGFADSAKSALDNIFDTPSDLGCTTCEKTSIRCLSGPIVLDA